MNRFLVVSVVTLLLCFSSRAEPVSPWVWRAGIGVVIVVATTGVGAIIGAVTTIPQDTSCCLALSKCREGESGTITTGTCAGPLDCNYPRIVNYEVGCVAEHEQGWQTVGQYAGVAAGIAVAAVISYNLFKYFSENGCPSCKRRGYDVLPSETIV